ncbi:MAG: hypothetical protein AAFY29_07440 [Pseudomonadota bacterium]
MDPVGPRAVGGTPPLKRVRRGSRRKHGEPLKEREHEDGESDKDGNSSPRKGRHIDERC